MLVEEVQADRVRNSGKWALLDAHMPGFGPQVIGILLLHEQIDKLHIKIKADWWLAQKEWIVDAELWGELSNDLCEKANRIGGRAVMDWLEDAASHTLRLRRMQNIEFERAEATLEELYRSILEVPQFRLNVLYDVPLNSRPAEKRFQTKANWLRATLAASLLISVFSTGVRAPVHVSEKKVPSRKSEPIIELPLNAGARFHTALFQVPSEFRLVTARSRRKKGRRIDLPVRHKFHIMPAYVPYRTEEAVIETPSCCDLSVDQSYAQIALPDEGAPEAPAFRPRRNKVVRLLAVLSTPFRLVVAR